MESSDTTYPLVVMANGTGVLASKYEPIFDHLASYGFIVIGNEDGESWNGLSSAESLDFMLDSNKDTSSIFYGKIDTANIGIAGHSQGGIGAISAVIDHGDMLANADGYMTAWFMSHLKGDEEAGKVFIGEDAKILDNANWQDIEKNHENGMDFLPDLQK